MKKKFLTYSSPKSNINCNLLIKNNLKVKHNPKTAKFYYTGKDLSNLGFISSSGGSNINADYFNIFSKSALFDYDTAKKINEFCQTKKDLGEITYYNLKKRRILTEYMNFDNVDIIDNPFASSYTYIKRIVVSKLGEGIAYASTFDILSYAFFSFFISYLLTLFLTCQPKEFFLLLKSLYKVIVFFII